jgi:hypothetical protein
MDRDQRREFVKDHRTCIFGYARQDAGDDGGVLRDRWR